MDEVYKASLTVSSCGAASEENRQARLVPRWRRGWESQRERLAAVRAVMAKQRHEGAAANILGRAAGLMMHHSLKPSQSSQLPTSNLIGKEKNHHHHQKVFRNKSHTSHGQRTGLLKRNKSKGKILTII